MTTKIVFYHHNCPDGFGAAYAAWKRFGDQAEYISCRHGIENELPDCTDKEVFILDFCFPAEILTRLGDQAKKVTVWDHHATWVEKLKDFKHPKVAINLDMAHSGAVLAWNYFHPGRPVPIMLQHIEDRDLWAWKLQSSADYLAALDIMPFDFEMWDGISGHAVGSPEYENFVNAGEVMNLKFITLCQELAEGAREITLKGHKGMIRNVSGSFVSKVGNILSEQCGTFALLWSIEDPATVRCSLRSKEGFNVRVIAEAFGGGGHNQAAGFSIPLEQLPALLNGSL